MHAYLIYLATVSSQWLLNPHTHQPHSSDVWGREAIEESETNLKVQDYVPETDVPQPPSPVRRGPEGDDTGRDDTQLVYASISNEHIQKKR